MASDSANRLGGHVVALRSVAGNRGLGSPESAGFLKRLTTIIVWEEQAMTITINGTPITLGWGTILLWAVIGLVAGFFASRLALGHGLGLIGDIVVDIPKSGP